MDIYVVQPGNTVDQIAEAFGVPVSTLILDNQLIPPYALAVGQTLLLDNGAAANEKRELVSFGYAYPYISPWVLEQTLPFLTELYVFSYGFTAEGVLLPPHRDDSWMVERSLAQGVRPILTLTPLGPNGQFNNGLIHSVVHNPSYKETLISQLLEVLNAVGYQGVDVDFEYILAEDRDAFTEFVRDLTEALHRNGYHSSVALAPKTSADQPGLLYEGKDYPSLGAIVDSVLLMTYEWGYKYGQ